MFFNNFKLEFILELQFNYYFKNCSCQYCKCNCHHYRLLQINSIKKEKKKIYQETRLHSPIRRPFSTRGNESRFSTYRERTFENEENDFSKEESSTSSDLSSSEEESGKDPEDNETDEEDVSKQQDVNEELTSIKVKQKPTRSSRNREELITSITDMSTDIQTITLKTTHPNSFRGGTIKTRIFIL